ncbi:MAG: MBOAT family protein, partial [Thermoleophilia bacterium]|nr:MBOAT family protein [Thermoleophilia bacterium]
MLFPTITFAVFFLVVYTANWLLMPRLRLWKWFIIGASYVFYGWWDWRLAFLLIGATLVNQALGVQV